MNLDRTFCSSKRCTKRITCDRWTYNLNKVASERGINLEGRRISVAEFSDHDGKCEMYSEIEPTHETKGE